MTKVDRTNNKDLQKSLALIEVLQQGLGYSATLEQVRVFLTFCREEGLTGVEYRKIIGVPQPSLSRHLLDLGDYRRDKAPGLGLIAAKIEVEDLRSRRYSLSLKGRSLLHNIQKVMA